LFQYLKAILITHLTRIWKKAWQRMLGYCKCLISAANP